MIGPRLIPIPHRAEDDRGWFARSYERVEDFVLAEENHSYSARAGTIRGLHWQEPQQTKLIRVLRGAILDVVVNLQTLEVRRYDLTPLSGSLYVPKGWAHGFCTLTDEVEVLYKVDAAYAPDGQCGLNPFDPALGVEWPVHLSGAVMSEKDRNAPLLQPRAA